MSHGHADGRQLGPQLLPPNRLGDGQLRVPIGRVAAVTFLLHFELLGGDLGEVVRHLFLDVGGDILMDVSLIAFERQHILPAAVDDLPGNVLLTAGRVDGHDGVLHVQVLQQGWNRRDFVGFLLRGQLPQADSKLDRPGADEEQRAQLTALVMRAPERFAVDGDLLGLPCVRGKPSHMIALKRGGPPREAGLKGGRLERGQHAANGVVRRHAMRQRQHLQQPIFLGRRPGSNRLGTIRAGQRGANANHDDLTQRVFAIDRTPRVRQVPKKLQDRNRIRFFDDLHLATLPC